MDERRGVDLRHLVTERVDGHGVKLTAGATVGAVLDATAFAEHAKRLDEDGYTIVEDAIEADLVDELATELRNLETFFDVQPAGNSFEGAQTLRVYNLLALGRVWERVPGPPERAAARRRACSTRAASSRR